MADPSHLLHQRVETEVDYNGAELVSGYNGRASFDVIERFLQRLDISHQRRECRDTGARQIGRLRGLRDCRAASSARAWLARLSAARTFGSSERQGKREVRPVVFVVWRFTKL
jgi:hypothetical protein